VLCEVEICKTRNETAPRRGATFAVWRLKGVPQESEHAPATEIYDFHQTDMDEQNGGRRALVAQTKRAFAAACENVSPPSATIFAFS
jgi:hypothetical protein